MLIKQKMGYQYNILFECFFLVYNFRVQVGQDGLMIHPLNGPEFKEVAKSKNIIIGELASFVLQKDSSSI